MKYEVLEQDVLTRLLPINAANPNISVVKMPELEGERSRPLPTKAKITVIYAGSEYDITSSTNNVRQNEKVFIQLLIESTFLRGTEGIYNIIEVVKSLLIGFRPSGGCLPIQMVKHHTVGNEDAQKINNMWAYNMILQTSGGLVVENFEESFISILKKITLIDKPGDEETIIPNPNNIPD